MEHYAYLMDRINNKLIENHEKEFPPFSKINFVIFKVDHKDSQNSYYMAAYAFSLPLVYSNYGMENVPNFIRMPKHISEIVQKEMEVYIRERIENMENK